MKKLLLTVALAGLAACTGSLETSPEGRDVANEVDFIEATAEGQYIVAFRDMARGKSALRAAGGEVLMDITGTNAAAARIPAAALRGLRLNANFEYIEEDVKREPLSESIPYGIPMVQADLVTQPSPNARKVCIIDSGLYASHEDIQRTGVSGYGSTWNADGCGHGTHVAGTIAGLGGNNLGVVGVNPLGVNLYIVRVFGDDCGWTRASRLADAANRCASAGANVINMSLGGGRRSKTEERTFNKLWSQGVLSIAAAGNNGTTSLNYPASYPSVVSVGAVDSNKVAADFSQKNAEVDVAAPGVAVLSTVPFADNNHVTAAGVTRSGTYVTGAARSQGVSATLVDGGLCDAASATWSGKTVVCQRGAISFAAKVQNVQSSGGVAAVIYNNVPGGFGATLGDGVTSTVPAIAISQEDGQALLASVGTTGTVVSYLAKPASGYEAWDGTSMAAPHVAGVAALVWAQKPTWTNTQIREALERTAQDLGPAGRDDAYGHGLVQAKSALDYLRATYP
ncbi:MAG TPA: S8 family serine peptidase [Myxococcaceae bacterium]|nr:S8 family serine peptidase [Myxococcaceae bacterium]